MFKVGDIVKRIDGATPRYFVNKHFQVTRITRVGINNKIHCVSLSDIRSLGTSNRLVYAKGAPFAWYANRLALVKLTPSYSAPGWL